MSKKTKILMLTNIVVLLFIGNNLISSQALSYDWFAGSVYTFGTSMKNEVEVYDAETDAHIANDVRVLEEGYYNITSFNLINKRYEAFYTSQSGSGSIFGYDFGYEDFIDQKLGLTDFFSFNYEWNYGSNETVLTGFDVGFSAFNFLEPNWAKINEAWVDLFNETVIIDTVADPFEPIIHNITLGDFYASLPSYTIMGKDTIAKGKDQFNADTHSWSFEFDLSGLLKNGLYNATLGYNVYFAFSTYSYYFDISYSKGGTLDNWFSGYIFDITQDTETTTFLYELHTAFGGLKAVTADFAFLAVIPAMLSIVFVYKVARKRNERRTR
ncbi:MAG: hypothetical protein ACTSSH_10690 [Candidatus Heimdallarchaeota archaeon]